MQVPLLDLKRAARRIKEEVLKEWDRALDEMRLLGGFHLKAFEEEIASYIGTRYAFGVASGSDALLLGLLACGIGPGDEVMVHANAFMAAVEAIKWAGARPVLVEAREEDFGPDPEDILRKLTPRTKAIIVVHMYGHPAYMEPLLEIKQSRGLKLIEDCSHAHGAEYKGKKVGGFGDVGCFSCGVVKNLGAFGDAGFCTTDDPEVAQKLDLLRVHGQKKKNEHLFYGFNSRLDELQAVVLRIRLRLLDEDNERRRHLARMYTEALKDIKEVKTPPEFEDRKSVYHRYVIRTPQREELMAFLKEAGIETGVQYPVPLHKQQAWIQEGYGEVKLPVSEKICAEVLSLPLFPELQEEEVQYVIDKVKEFFEGR